MRRWEENISDWLGEDIAGAGRSVGDRTARPGFIRAHPHV